MKELLLSNVSLIALGIFVLWMAILLLAKRRRIVRVTLGPIWQRLIAKSVVPSKKQRLRRLIAALLSFVMIFAATHWVAATLFPPLRPENRAPIDLICLIDTSPSTLRMRANGTTTLATLIERAEDEVSKLSPVDRAWLMWRQDGVVVSAGPFRGGQESYPRIVSLRAGLRPDFLGVGTAPYRKALESFAFATTPWEDDEAAKAWPELVESNRIGQSLGRARHLALFSDHDADFLHLADADTWPENNPFNASLVRRYGIGAHGYDYRFTDVSYTSDGRLRLDGDFPEHINLEFLSGIVLPTSRFTRSGNRLEVVTSLPRGQNGIRISLDPQGDAIPLNNVLELVGRSEVPLSIGFLARNEFFSAGLKKVFTDLLPSDTRRLQLTRRENEDAQDTIVISESGGFTSYDNTTRALVCFGRLPSGYDVTQSLVTRTEPVSGVLHMPSEMIGEEDYAELREFQVKRAMIPTYPAVGNWQVLLQVEGLGPLVAYSEGYGVPILHVACELDESDLMSHPALPLLLRRWLSPMLLPEIVNNDVPPLYRNGDIIEMNFPSAKITVLPPPEIGSERQYLWSSEKGAKGFADSWLPGSYRVNELGVKVPRTEMIKVQWIVDDYEIPARPVAALPTPEFAPLAYRGPEALISSRELTLLFLLALLALVAEWALYWLGASE